MHSEFQKLRAALFEKRERIACELDRYNALLVKWRKLNTRRGRATITADDDPGFLLAARHRRILEQVVEYIDESLRAATTPDSMDEATASNITSRWERLAARIDELYADEDNNDQESGSVSNG